jgi:hypothetical protein
VPESRNRRKQRPYTPPPAKVDPSSKVSPKWLAPTMVACFLIGLIWIILYYLFQSDIGFLNALGPWNLLIGFGFFGVGFALATQWR